MGQLKLFSPFKFSNRHLHPLPNNDTIRPTLKPLCVHASFNEGNYAAENPRSQRQAPGNGRTEPQSRDGGGRGRGRSGSSPRGQETRRFSPRDANRNNIQNPPAPKYDMLVVVEGVNDMKAVRKTLNADVYVLRTATRAGDPQVHSELLSFLHKYRGIVLLLDPDVAGRQARNILNKVIPDCWHAFVPSPLAVAAQARGYKETGNIGVEHAPPKVIIEALKRRRKGVEGRNEFTKENLYDVGLVAAEFERGGNVRERRKLVCDFLGIGMSDGKQLIKQLNTYGFSKKDLEAALAWAEPRLPAKEKET